MKRKLTDIQQRAIAGMAPGREYSYDQLQRMTHAAQGLGAVVDSLQARGLINIDGRRAMQRGATLAERRAACKFQLTTAGIEARRELLRAKRRTQA